MVPAKYRSHSNVTRSQPRQNLARTLMMPVILFKADNDEYGVLSEDDLDGDEVDARYLCDPYWGPAV